MALSNKFGEILLTTGNKSEVAVGYATIYGDMAGGYNPIKDVYKTRVFALCRWRNDTHRDWMMGPAGTVIPPRVIDKPPSAELRPDQRDDDSLPSYDVLDRILELLVDEDASVADCVAEGFDRATVEKVETLLYISEYKRFQSAPGARLSKKAFWLDRRYPTSALSCGSLDSAGDRRGFCGAGAVRDYCHRALRAGRAFASGSLDPDWRTPAAGAAVRSMGLAGVTCKTACSSP